MLETSYGHRLAGFCDVVIGQKFLTVADSMVISGTIHMSLNQKSLCFGDVPALKTSIWNVCPQDVSLATNDPSLRLTQLALSGYAQLSADSMLRKENNGKLLPIIERAVDELDRTFQSKPENRSKCVEVLLEISLNLLGMERKRAGFTDDETTDALSRITRALQKWELAAGIQAFQLVIDQTLTSMKMVLSGKGMVAKMAEEIEGKLSSKDLAKSFIESSKDVIQNNIYYRIVDGKLSKFGNDSATGLRWARHLGAVQVSSNPVIAARAYEEIADLWKKFDAVAATHPEWSEDPERFEDEIALYGTVTSLLPNILDFRPIALLSDFKDGMVSIQLNPQKATNIEESVKDALKFCSILGDILQEYDIFLTGKAATEKARLNIVFKVSTSGVEALGLTENLDGRGIGTNNTVTFTVAQEIRMTLIVMKGLAAALKSGMPITTVYMTNMEGRLEDHLRESKAARILGMSLEAVSDKESRIIALAEKVGANNDLKGLSSLEDRINALSSKKYLKSLTDEWFVGAVGISKADELQQLEADIRMSGIYVTRRVFQTLFSPEMKPKLIKYLCKEFEITESQATKIIEAIDLLPASKRRAEDTYLVLGNSLFSNLTNTEFPDHQQKVLQRSREPGFRLQDFENSISEEPDLRIIERLLEIPDFKRAYNLNSDLVGQLRRIGIETSEEESGINPGEWSSYGPVRKTMDEFNSAYLSFRSKLVKFVAKSGTDREIEITNVAKAR